MTVIAIRPASFSMSTSRDAYRALALPVTRPPESPPANQQPSTQGHHHPKYPHLSVVHVVKERASDRLLPDRRKEARLYNTIELGQGQRLICRVNPASALLLRRAGRAHAGEITEATRPARVPPGSCRHRPSREAVSRPRFSGANRECAAPSRRCRAASRRRPDGRASGRR